MEISTLQRLSLMILVVASILIANHAFAKNIMPPTPQCTPD